MAGPFNFKIQITEEERFRRRVLYAATAVLLTAAFTACFIIVHVNSYNIIHSEPMEVFGFYRNAEDVGVVIFNRFFRLFSLG